MRTAEVVPEAPVCELGESPVWDERSGALVWVDLLAGLIHRLEPGTGGAPGAVTTTAVGRPVGCLAPRRRGGWVLATELGFEVLDSERRGLPEPRVAVLAAEDGLRFNDGACDAGGRFFAGTLAYDDRPGQGALFRLDVDGSVTTLLTGLGISNGIGWSPDASVMYHVDSDAGTVYAADYDLTSGAFHNRRPFHRVTTGGVPDGLAVDAEGAIWVAVWDGGQVLRLSPTGVVEDHVTLDVPRPTSIAFGGPDLDRLYITSAREGLSEDELGAYPASGRLFVADPGCRGLPTPAWAG